MLFIACTNQEKEAVNSDELIIETSTNEISLLEIGDFNNKAGEYVNTEIQIRGTIDHVCKHGGKKLLLVNNDGDVHVTSPEERFPDDLIGEEILVNGIVEEFRVDEEYCIQMEDDNIASHKEGKSDSELFEKKKLSIQAYRDSMKISGVDHLSYYSLVFVSYEILDDKSENSIQ